MSKNNVFEDLIQTIEKNAIDNKATISNVKIWAKSWRDEFAVGLKNELLPIEFLIWYSGMGQEKILNAHKKWVKENTQTDLEIRCSCIHCGNNDQSKFEVREELEYDDGSDEPTTGNHLINVEFAKCLKCGEVI